VVKQVRYVVALLVVLVVAAACFPAVQSPSATPSSVVAPSPTSSAPSATASPTSGIVTYDSPILGYRISLPATYRRLSPVLFTGQSEILGRDAYTLQTEQEEREECLRDLGDLPPPSAAALLFVEAYRNVANVAVTEWVSTPRVRGAQPLSMHTRVEPLTIGGREAVRLVADNATAEVQLFAIRADDRIYVITPTMWMSPPQHQLASIAATFGTIARQPLPTPTPTTPPSARQQAATEVAQALARAFAGRDADAVARLMPQCRLGVSLAEPLPNSGGGGLGRSVALFTQALRDRFAAGDLVVTVDTIVQLQTEGGPYAARSDWREPDRTVRIDLILNASDGGSWRWVAAIHHYQQTDFIKPYCIPYRSPWVTPTGSC